MRSPLHCIFVLSSISTILSQRRITKQKNKQEDPKDDQKPFPPSELALFLTSRVCEGIVTWNTVYTICRGFALQTICWALNTCWCAKIVPFWTSITGRWTSCASVTSCGTSHAVETSCTCWAVTKCYYDE